MAPHAMPSSNNHTKRGWLKFFMFFPINHLIPSLLNKERIELSGSAAVSSQDKRMTTTWIIIRIKISHPILFFHRLDSSFV